MAVCADDDPELGPPSGSQFSQRFAELYPDWQRQVSVNVVAGLPYVDGSIIGVTKYVIRILPISKPYESENGSTVGYLETYRRPSAGGYGWAWHYSHPIVYNRQEITQCFDDGSGLCPCPGHYATYQFAQCSEQAANWDYNFRITRASQDSGSFTFHAAVAFQGYFI